MGINLRKDIKWIRVAGIFLFLILVLLVVEFALIERDYKSEMNQIKAGQISEVESIELIAMEHLSLVYKDILILKENKSLQGFLLDPSQGNAQTLRSYFYNYMTIKEDYNQIRFIDVHGLERIRVDNDYGLVKIVEEDDLQDKSDRYYFKEAIGIDPGQIYVSPLDLNIENKLIEVPYKPMIRFCSPLYLGGDLKGLVVLNYFAQEFLTHIKPVSQDYTNQVVNVYLLNEMGYYLVGPEEKTWTFMFEDKADQGFFADYPQIWEKMNIESKGQFLTDQGLFTYSNLSYSNSRGPYGENNTRNWRLVSHIPKSQMKDIHFSIIRKYHGNNVYYLLVALVLSVMVSLIISLRRQVRKTLILAKETAESSNEMKTKFLADISHEIRTPMHAIIGMSFLALQDDVMKTTEDYLLNIHNSANSLMRLINDILDFSKIEIGRLTLERVPFNLRLLVESLKSLFYLSVNDSPIHYKYDVDPKIPEVILGDPGRLNQVFLNLLSNATKFTKEGFIELKIMMKSESFDCVTLSFAVTDTGLGMDEDQISRVFSAYNQGDTSTSRLYGGTGLGLSISKNLVELMGGDLIVESQKGLGTSFFFDLDFKIAKETDLINQVHSTYQDIGYLKHNLTKPLLTVTRNMKKNDIIHNVRVLIVDDNLYNQIILSELLKRVNCHIELANNGQEALEKVEAGSYDLIFMDIQMPLMDGYEATRRIRAMETKGRVPIIGTSANILESDRDKAFDAGIDDYLIKPIDVEAFYKLVSKALDIELVVSTKALVDRFDDVDPRVIDFKLGLDYFMNDVSKYCKTINEVLVTYKEGVSKLQLMVKRHDYKGALAYIHEMKGVFANYGLTKCYQASKVMEADLLKFKVGRVSDDMAGLDQAIRDSVEEADKLQVDYKKSIKTKEITFEEDNWLEPLKEALLTGNVRLIREVEDKVSGHLTVEEFADLAKALRNYDYEKALSLIQGL